MKHLRIVCALIALALLTAILPLSAFADDYDKEYYITVDQTNQVTTVYRTADDVIVRQSLCTTGLNGATPNGTFYMPKGENKYDRQDWYYFTGFRVYAKYPTRVFKGVLFHSITYNKLDETAMSPKAIGEYGSPGSHGCIRLLVDDAQWIQEHCPIGTRVTVYESGVKDEELRSLLFQEHYTLESGLTYQEYWGLPAGALGRYSVGEDVAKLQYRLNQLGYYDGEIDGKFQDDTIDAVLKAQRDANMTLNGYVDAEFSELLFSENAPTVISGDIKEGDIGPKVRALQKNLAYLKLYGGEIDGIYDIDVINGANRFTSAYGYGDASVMTEEMQYAVAYECAQIRQKFSGKTFTAKIVNEAIKHAKVTFDGKKIRLRESPDSKSKQLASLPDGTELKLLELGEKWSQVQYKKTTGYMMTKYLTVTQTDYYHLKYSQGNDTYTIGLTLKARESGSKMPADTFKATYQELLKQKKANDKVEVEANITTPASLVSESEASKETTTYTGKVNTGTDDVRLNLRAEPNTGAEILDELTNGTELKVLVRNGEWAYVEENGRNGYLLSQYLDLYDDEGNLVSTQGNAAGTESTVTAKESTIVTDQGFTYVYKDADKKSAKTGFATTGSTVAVYEENGDFVRVRYGEDFASMGYIPKSVLGAITDIAPGSEMDQNIQMVVFAYVIDGKSAKMYKGESTDSGMLKKISPGEKVTVLEAPEDSEWCKVRYKKKTGYMKNSDLRFDMETA